MGDKSIIDLTGAITSPSHNSSSRRRSRRSSSGASTSSTSSKKNSRRSKRSSVSSRDNYWSCPDCTFQNQQHATICDICGHVPPSLNEPSCIVCGNSMPQSVLRDHLDLHIAQGDLQRTDPRLQSAGTLESQATSARAPSWDLDDQWTQSRYEFVEPLSTALVLDSAQTTETRLCTTSLSFFGWTANWACGYRNEQMLISAVLSSKFFAEGGYAVHFSQPHCRGVPSVRALQSALEQAWQLGFDAGQGGAGHFGGRVVGTKRWIGGTDVTATLRSLGIRAHLVDFENVRPLPGMLKNSFIEFVWQYFCTGPLITKTAMGQVRGVRVVGDSTQLPRTNEILPLYLQHQGHSRTIVGIQRISPSGSSQPDSNRDMVYLLLADPGKNPRSIVTALQSPTNGQWKKLIRVPWNKFSHRMYQIVYIDPALEPLHEEHEDFERFKTLVSDLHFS